MITQEELKRGLEQWDTWVERALVVLYHRQTEAEQQSHSTQSLNGQGFSSSDAPLGTYMARWILEGKHLTGRFLLAGRTLTLKYTRQLLEAAEKKEQRRTAA